MASAPACGRLGRRFFAALCAALALALAPGGGDALAAQQATRALRVARPQAWIGFSFELRESWRVGSDRTAPVMVVTDVHPDSPARRGGLQVGDTILSLDRAAVSPESLARFQATLEPGAEVRVTLRREGRVRDVRLTAQARPADEVLISFSPEVRVQMDSAHALFLEHLDSARVAPGISAFRYALGSDTVRALVFTSPTGDPGPGTGWITLPDPAFAAPFSLMLVDDARSQELSGRLAELDRQMREARLRQARRTEELARQGRLDALREDGVIRQQLRRQDEIRREAERVKAEMQRLAETTLARRASQAAAVATRTRAVTVDGSASSGAATARAERFGRPLSPYITGQDRVAGARLTPLNPELGAYFGVERGLLVVEVGTGTPAADARLLPGDVVVRVGDRETATLEELRRELAGSSRSAFALVTVIRKGRRIELALPR